MRKLLLLQKRPSLQFNISAYIISSEVPQVMDRHRVSSGTLHYTVPRSNCPISKSDLDNGIPLDGQMQIWIQPRYIPGINWSHVLPLSAQMIAGI